MAVTKNALIRYRTIDKCLQNVYRKWTLEDLIEACSDALYEFEGRDVNVSTRTIQLDIQNMRSSKLGYNAPIMVYNKKFYKYDDPTFKISDIPLTGNDMEVLTEVVELLKQFKNFTLFSELADITHRLEDKIYSERTHTDSIVHLDKNTNVKGLEHLEVIYQTIRKKLVLDITYHSFMAKVPRVLKFHPFLLKEFDNRWYVIGKRSADKPIRNLALDRIVQIDIDYATDHLNEPFNGDEFYKNTIGITVLEGEEGIPTKLILKVNARSKPYVLTKPLHQSQKLLKEKEDGGIIVSLKVHLNRELENIIMAMGDEVQILEPLTYASYIKEKHLAAVALYL